MAAGRLVVIICISICPCVASMMVGVCLFASCLPCLLFVLCLVCCRSCWLAGPCLVVVVVVVCVEDVCSSVLLLHLGEVRSFPDVCWLSLGDCVGLQMFVGCLCVTVWVPICFLVVFGWLCGSLGGCCCFWVTR